MDRKIAQVAAAMMQKNLGDKRRIEHSLKVYAYAQYLGHSETINAQLQETLEVTALLHDIGIHVSEKKYGKCTSLDQEKEGPPVARDILENLGFNTDLVERVCYIISKHHTFSAVDLLDFQLLVEADFLVNSSEDNMSDYQIIHFAKNIFRTESGLNCLRLLYPHIAF